LSGFIEACIKQFYNKKYVLNFTIGRGNPFFISYLVPVKPVLEDPYRTALQLKNVPILLKCSQLARVLSVI
jgi:hypothetical protein